MIGVGDMDSLNLKDGQYEGNSAVVLDLGSSQTMQSVPDLHAALVASAEKALPLIVDAASIERFGTASVQVLLAARQTFAERDIPMIVRSASDAFLGAFRDLGIEPGEQDWISDEGGNG